MNFKDISNRENMSRFDFIIQKDLIDWKKELHAIFISFEFNHLSAKETSLFTILFDWSTIITMQPRHLVK